MSFFSDEEFQEFEFAVGEHHTSGYDPDRVPEITCIWQVGAWCNALCGDPIDGESLFCKAHGNYLLLCQLQKALKAGDLEAAEMHLEDMGLTLGDLKGRVEMGVAA